jgi:hypothetical protein
METGILYVVFNKTIRDEKTNELLYKIGITKNAVDIRYHSVGLKMPGKFETLFAYRLKDYIKAEQALHNILKKYRENGEWFKISQNELDYIQKTCELMGGILITNEIEIETRTDYELGEKLPQPRNNNSIHSENPINPNRPCKIFVFSIRRSYNGKNVYDATRSAWKKIGKFLDITEYRYAVGVVNKYSLGSFKITEKWKLVQDNRYEFTGDEISEFTGFSWDKQIEKAGGWWKYCNPLVVEFDGCGKFRLLLPGTKKDHWEDC